MIADHSNEAPLTGKKILLVEDAPDNRRIMSYLLEDSGAEVSGACNGAEAIEKVQQESYDLVIMDINMPVMDGIEAMHHIQKFKTHPPVVALTALDDHDHQALMAKGFESLIAKPLKPLSFLSSMKTILQLD